MSDEDSYGAPAGWYPDPLGLPQLRWWNNHGWTEQVSAAPEPTINHQPGVAWKDEVQNIAPAVAPIPPSYPGNAQPRLAPGPQPVQAPAAAARVEEPSRYTKYSIPGWNGTSS